MRAPGNHFGTVISPPRRSKTTDDTRWSVRRGGGGRRRTRLPCPCRSEIHEPCSILSPSAFLCTNLSRVKYSILYTLASMFCFLHGGTILYSCSLDVYTYTKPQDYILISPEKAVEAMSFRLQWMPKMRKFLRRRDVDISLQ